MRFCTLCLLCLFAVVTHHFFGFEEDFFFGVTAAAVVGRKEDFDASLDVFGETVEVPTLKSSAYYYGKKKKKKNNNDMKKEEEEEEEDDDESVEVPTLSSAYGKKKNNNNGMRKKKKEEEKTKEEDDDEKSACEDCVSFLREMSDQVRSKHFRERAYKVVDEMCERVFDTDREKTTECEAMGKTYAKKAIDYAKTLSEEDKGKAACKKMHLCKKKKKTRRRFWSSSTIGTMEDAARRAARRARERVASGTFFASWFSSSSSSSPRKKTRETEKEETQRSLSSSPPSSSMCAFCEYGASKLATAMNDPDFAESAKREFIAACVASETFSDEQCKNAADEYEAKFYDALQTWLDDGEACEDLLGC